MKPQILKALKGSIEKWEKLVSGEGDDQAGENCPLCKVEREDCGNCPVCEKTNQPECWGTPYEKWKDHHFKVHRSDFFPPFKIECNWCTRFAKQEVEFLKSLLPK